MVCVMGLRKAKCYNGNIGVLRECDHLLGRWNVELPEIGLVEEGQEDFVSAVETLGSSSVFMIKKISQCNVYIRSNLNIAEARWD